MSYPKELFLKTFESWILFPWWQARGNKRDTGKPWGRCSLSWVLSPALRQLDHTLPSLRGELRKGNNFCAPNEEGRSSPASTEIPYDEQRQVQSFPSVPTVFRFKSMS